MADQSPHDGNGILGRVIRLEESYRHLAGNVLDLERQDLKELKGEVRRLRESDIQGLREHFDTEIKQLREQDIAGLKDDFTDSRRGMSRHEKWIATGVIAAVVGSFGTIIAVVTQAPQ